MTTVLDPCGNSQITGLHMGRNGKNRVAQVKGTVIRPVIKLNPLEQDLRAELVSIRSTDLSLGIACHKLPLRRAALGSVKLWRRGINQGLL